MKGDGKMDLCGRKDGMEVKDFKGLGAGGLNLHPGLSSPGGRGGPCGAWWSGRRGCRPDQALIPSITCSSLSDPALPGHLSLRERMVSPKPMQARVPDVPGWSRAGLRPIAPRREAPLSNPERPAMISARGLGEALESYYLSGGESSSPYVLYQRSVVTTPHPIDGQQDGQVAQAAPPYPHSSCRA